MNIHQGSDASTAPPNREFLGFSEETLVVLEEALRILVDETHCRCAMLADQTGAVLASDGDFSPIGVESMGATAAGVVAALNSMVSQTTSPEVSIKLYGADPDKIHFMLVGGRIVLCVLFSRQTTVGQIRAGARTLAQSILPIITREDALLRDTQSIRRSVQYIESKLDDLFKDIT